MLRILQIMYHIDNCSVVSNQGGLLETHTDLHSSANTFYWKVWSSTFKVFPTVVDVSAMSHRANAAGQHQQRFHHQLARRVRSAIGAHAQGGGKPCH